MNKEQLIKLELEILAGFRELYTPNYTPDNVAFNKLSILAQKFNMYSATVNELLKDY